jgi:hypothetical protein
MGAINSTPEKIQEMFENVQRAKAKSAPSFD